MTIDFLFNWVINILKDAKISDYYTETIIIFCEVLNCSRLNLFLNKDKILSEKDIAKIKNIVNQRLNRIPLQYILNKAWFYNNEFYIDKDVFIPRPETELIIDIVKSLVETKFNRINEIKIADICCGSGCIGVTLAQVIHNCKVTCIDISEKAILNTQINAKKLGVIDKINILKIDILKEFSYLNNKFHLIVSNPPYIPSNDIANLEPEVKYNEPRIALDGGNDGLTFYLYFAQNLKNILFSNGYLCLEIGANQKERVMNIFKEYNYKNIDVIKDLNGIERIIILKNLDKSC